MKVAVEVPREELVASADVPAPPLRTLFGRTVQEVAEDVFKYVDMEYAYGRNAQALKYVFTLLAAAPQLKLGEHVKEIKEEAHRLLGPEHDRDFKGLLLWADTRLKAMRSTRHKRAHAELKLTH